MRTDTTACPASGQLPGTAAPCHLQCHLLHLLLQLPVWSLPPAIKHPLLTVLRLHAAFSPSKNRKCADQYIRFGVVLFLRYLHSAPQQFLQS